MARGRLIDLDTLRDLAPEKTVGEIAAHFGARRKLIEEIGFVHAVPLLPDAGDMPVADGVLKMDRAHVEELIHAGEPFSAIGAKYGVSRERIRQIANEIGVTGRARDAARTQARHRRIAVYARTYGIEAASRTYRLAASTVKTIVRAQTPSDPVAEAAYAQRLEQALADLRAGHAFERTRTTYGIGEHALKAACEADGIILSRSRANIAENRVRLVEAMVARGSTMAEIYQAVLNSESHHVLYASFYAWMTKRGYTAQIAAQKDRR